MELVTILTRGKSHLGQLSLYQSISYKPALKHQSVNSIIATWAQIWRNYDSWNVFFFEKLELEAGSLPTQVPNYEEIFF